MPERETPQLADAFELPLGVYEGMNRYETDTEHVLHVWREGQSWDVRRPRNFGPPPGEWPCRRCSYSQRFHPVKGAIRLGLVSVDCSEFDPEPADPEWEFQEPRPLKEQG